MADAVGGGHLQDRLDGFLVVVSAVPPDDEGAVSNVSKRVENGLNEVLEIVGLLKDRDLFAQPGGAGFLVRKGCGFDRQDVHIAIHSII